MSGPDSDRCREISPYLDQALDLEPEALADHRPVRARPDSFGYRAAKFARRHRGASVGGLLTTLAIIAGLAGTVSQARRAQHERDRAMHDLTFAEASNEFMRFLLSEGANKPFTTADLLERAAQSVGKQFAATSICGRVCSWSSARNISRSGNSNRPKRCCCAPGSPHAAAPIRR